MHRPSDRGNPTLRRCALGWENRAADGVGNLTKINRVPTRTLIIHGGLDFLIPVSEAEALYAHSAAREKRLVRIPDAGHNDL